jgi:hypothetical protein
MFPTIPGGSPPPAYAPLLLDTPQAVQSQPRIYPPSGAQSLSSPSISDEIQFIGEKSLSLRNMFTNLLSVHF